MRGAEGRLNLNFQANPYGVAFLNPWNMLKYPILTLNSKIDFNTLKSKLALLSKPLIYGENFKLDFWIQWCSSLVWHVSRIQKSHPIWTRLKVEFESTLRALCCTLEKWLFAWISTRSKVRTWSKAKTKLIAAWLAFFFHPRIKFMI